jgi:hypothetical protein
MGGVRLPREVSLCWIGNIYLREEGPSVFDYLHIGCECFLAVYRFVL